MIGDPGGAGQTGGLWAGFRTINRILYTSHYLPKVELEKDLTMSSPAPSSSRDLYFCFLLLSSFLPGDRSGVRGKDG
jgi:hypothetical protein